MRYIVGVVVILAVFLSSSGAMGADANNDTQDSEANSGTILIDFPTASPVTLGQGWKIASADKVEGGCIIYSVKTLNYNDKQLLYRKVIDNESLARGLGISASASFKSITSAYSATVSLARETKFSSTSTYLSVLAEVWRGPIFVAPPVQVGELQKSPVIEPEQNSLELPTITSRAVLLHPDFEKLALENRSEFYRKCGDGFVAAIHSGAIVRAVVEFQGVSEEEREAISGSVSGGAGGGSISGSMNATMNSYQSRNRLTITSNSQGGNDQTMSISVEALNKEIETLPAYAKVSPRPLKMNIRKYSSLNNFPSGPPTNSITDQELIARVYGRLQTLRVYTEEALKANWLLKLDTQRQDVENLSDQITKDMTRLSRLAIECARGDICQTDEWRVWSDIPYRARLPYRGRFADLKINPDLSDLPQKLADARVDQWIKEPLQVRCEIDPQECVLFEDINKVRAQIVKAIETRFKFQDIR